MSNRVHRTGLRRFLKRLGVQKSLIPPSMFALPLAPAVHGVDLWIGLLVRLRETGVEVKVASPNA
jgi:hypothetical protein